MSNSGLRASVFQPLSLREIRPEGWLLNQLRLQAEGLSGHLDQFWDDIKNSAWIGGDCEGWERMPYWLDGFIPLAWLLEDEDMKARATRYVEAILSRQEEDGWICPAGEDRSRYDVWAVFLILKVLIVYEDATGDERIQPAVRRALESLNRHIDVHTLFDWAQMRYFECLIAVFWLYEREPAEWLLELAGKLKAQGFNWQAFFSEWPYKRPEGKDRWSQMSHVVNNAMMLKSGALEWRMSGRDSDLQAARVMLDTLETYHGTVTGIFTGDECLAGQSPIQGTELCAVAELMYSSEILLQITGDAFWGDRLEKLAFNALPAAISPDMWTHQYDQQVNQIQCKRMENHPFNTNNGESNLFGLEPNFGCCTSNFNQAWPKFAASVFMKSEDGLAVTAYAPAAACTKVGGVPVEVRLSTAYPFRQELTLTVCTENPSDFAVYFRVPHWAAQGLVIDGETVSGQAGGFYRLYRRWEGRTDIHLELPMQPELAARPNKLIAVTRGPLVFALPLGERWVQVTPTQPGHEFPHCDYEVLPTTPWNYGLAIDRDDPSRSLAFSEHPVERHPFSPEGAPVTCTVTGRKIDWAMQDDCASPVPAIGGEAQQDEEIVLIPYGCTNLRMTEMPVV